MAVIRVVGIRPNEEGTTRVMAISRSRDTGVGIRRSSRDMEVAIHRSRATRSRATDNHIRNRGTRSSRCSNLATDSRSTGSSSPTTTRTSRGSTNEAMEVKLLELELMYSGTKNSDYGIRLEEVISPLSTQLGYKKFVKAKALCGVSCLNC